MVWLKINLLYSVCPINFDVDNTKCVIPSFLLRNLKQNLYYFIVVLAPWMPISGSFQSQYKIESKRLKKSLYIYIPIYNKITNELYEWLNLCDMCDMYFSALALIWYIN